MGCEVGASEHPAWGETISFVLRLPDRRTAKLVGICTEQEWVGEQREVVLPDELVDLLVATTNSLTLRNEVGFLRGWFVPEGDDAWRLHMMPGFEAPMR